MLDDKYQSLGRDHVDILAIGKKASDLLTAKGVAVKQTKHDLLDNITYDQVQRLAMGIMDAFTSGAYDEVRLVYNQFRNAASQDLVQEQYLPVLPPKKDRFSDSHSDYILEPSKEYIIEKLIPRNNFV